MDYFHSTGMEKLDQSSLHPLRNKAPLDGRGPNIGPVFVNVEGAQESILPRNRFCQSMYPGGPVRKIGLSYRPRQAVNLFLGSLKGLQLRAQAASASQRGAPPNIWLARYLSNFSGPLQ